MKNSKLLVVIEGQTAERDFLRSNFLSLAKKSFSQIIFLCQEEKLDSFQKIYQRDNVSFKGFREQKENWLREKFFQLLRHSIPTQTAKLRLLRTIYKRDGLQFNSWLLFFWPCYLSWYLSRYGFWLKFLRALWRIFIPVKDEMELLAKIKPDLVYLDYTPIGIKNFNLRLIKAAKKLGILTVGNIVSWDQLTSKTFITEQSDFLTVHNEKIKQEAIKFGDFNSEVIQITGVPRFDFYFKQDLYFAREEFFQQIGVDPSKKLIVFAGGLREFNIDYEYFFHLFSQIALELGSVQFYLRPYPDLPFAPELLQKYHGDPGLIFGKPWKNFEALLANLFLHSSVLICVYSTLMIEACLADLPIINLSYFPLAKYKKYYEPFRQLQKNHLRDIFQNNCCEMAKSDQQLAQLIKEYLANPALDGLARKKIAQEQVGFLDGKSSQRVFLAIQAIINN